MGEGNESTIKNYLDHKYLTELERVEIKKYKDIYYIGHKAHLRKVKWFIVSIKKTLETRMTITSL